MTPRAEKFVELNRTARIVQAGWRSLGSPEKLTFRFENNRQISLSEADLKSIRKAGVRHRWFGPNNSTFEH